MLWARIDADERASQKSGSGCNEVMEVQEKGMRAFIETE
jgi:hypothetical protein